MNKLIVNPGETRTPNLAGWFHGSIQLSYWASFNVLIKIQKKWKVSFGVADGLAPSTSKGLPLVLCYWATPPEYISTTHNGLFKGARYSRTERAKLKINLNNKNTITSSPGELTRMHFKLKLYSQFSFFVDLGRVGRSCLRMMSPALYRWATDPYYAAYLHRRTAFVMQNIINKM